jgi:hypothetical protein
MKLSDASTLVVTALVLIATLVIKYCTDGQMQITTNDMLVTAIAAVLMLFVTGRISEFGVGSQGLTVKAAIIAATKKRIARHIAPLPVETLQMSEKVEEAGIERFIKQLTPALYFVLGSNRYFEITIERYLDQLTRLPFFRFVILLTSDTDKTLFGMIDARKLLAQLRDPASGITVAEFTTVVNHGGPGAEARLKHLAGFVSCSAAVTSDVDQRGALKKMEELRTDWLPVVEASRLTGIVERSRLTASLILDVADQLDGSAEPATG